MPRRLEMCPFLTSCVPTEPGHSPAQRATGEAGPCCPGQCVPVGLGHSSVPSFPGLAGLGPSSAGHILHVQMAPGREAPMLLLSLLQGVKNGPSRGTSASSANKADNETKNSRRCSCRQSRAHAASRTAAPSRTTEGRRARRGSCRLSRALRPGGQQRLPQSPPDPQASLPAHWHPASQWTGTGQRRATWACLSCFRTALGLSPCATECPCPVRGLA